MAGRRRGPTCGSFPSPPTEAQRPGRGLRSVRSPRRAGYGIETTTPWQFHEPLKLGFAKPVEAKVPPLGIEPFSFTVPRESSTLPA